MCYSINKIHFHFSCFEQLFFAVFLRKFIWVVTVLIVSSLREIVTGIFECHIWNTTVWIQYFYRRVGGRDLTDSQQVTDGLPSHSVMLRPKSSQIWVREGQMTRPFVNHTLAAACKFQIWFRKIILNIWQVADSLSLKNSYLFNGAWIGVLWGFSLRPGLCK